MMLMNCLLVGCGGALGAVGRYLAGLLPFWPETDFPLSTLLINLAGAFAIGLITQLAAQRATGGSGAVLFFKTGICGGFTTFSTFSLESFSLLSAGKSGLALLYMALSVALCLLGIVLGQWLGQKLA